MDTPKRRAIGKTGHKLETRDMDGLWQELQVAGRDEASFQYFRQLREPLLDMFMSEASN